VSVTGFIDFALGITTVLVVDLSIYLVPALLIVCVTGFTNCGCKSLYRLWV